MAYIAKIFYGRDDESCGAIFQTRKAMFRYLADLSAISLAEAREITVYRSADPYADWCPDRCGFRVSGPNMHLIDRFPVRGNRVIVGVTHV